MMSDRLCRAVFALIALFLIPGSAGATPFYAAFSASSCDTCHAEPIGWKNPELKDRRCSLSCQSCHVSPTGGGLRTPYGKYFAREVLPLFGSRPSEHADLEPGLAAARKAEDVRRSWCAARAAEARSAGLPASTLSFYELDGCWKVPVAGRFRWSEGFSGWQVIPGSRVHTDIHDRVGDIDPNPTFDVGADFRGMVLVPLGDSDDDAAVFPMEAQVYGAWQPFDELLAYVDAGWQGSRANPIVDTDQSVTEVILTRVWVREVFLKLQKLPYNSWVRLGRFAPPYGWRIPDHTAFIREPFDQHRQGYGIEAGVNPNYAFGSLAVYWQGVADWPGEIDTLAGGPAVTAQAGWRDFGFTAAMSAHAMSIVRRAGESASGSEVMVGPMWGVNFHHFAVLGEFDYRNVDNGVADSHSLRLYNEAQWMAMRGLIAKLRHEWKDENLDFVDDHVHRITAGVQWTPVPPLQLDVSLQNLLRPGDSIEPLLLVQLHAYF